MNSQLAFIFPGQGSQSVGMLSELANTTAIVKEVFAEASSVLGYDLWQLVQDGPETDLNQTDKTQPAMLAAGVAVWRVWFQNNGGSPAMMAGHSLGEYTALVCAGALDFQTAIKLVAERGRFMQQAVPEGEGAMAAILGLDDDEVMALCDQAAQGEVVSAVNFNSPGQVVIAGTASGVSRAIEIAKEKGAKRALLLPVSVPSHCSLMEPAAQKMKQLLDETQIDTPNTAVISNVDVEVMKDPDVIRDALVRQLSSPVRWVETINKMKASGISALIECGPGKVLAGLNKRIDRTLEAFPVYDAASLEKALSSTGV